MQALVPVTFDLDADNYWWTLALAFVLFLKNRVMNYIFKKSCVEQKSPGQAPVVVAGVNPSKPQRWQF